MNVAQALSLATEAHPVILEVWERSPYGTDRLRVRHFLRDPTHGSSLMQPKRGYVVVRYGPNWTLTTTTAPMAGYVPPTMDYTKARDSAPMPLAAMPVSVVA